MRGAAAWDGSRGMPGPGSFKSSWLLPWHTRCPCCRHVNRGTVKLLCVLCRRIWGQRGGGCERQGRRI